MLVCFPCGGGHRAWDFCYEDNDTVFVHIKSREVVLSQAKFADRQHKVIKESLHGRELTCVKYLRSTAASRICVTASEDTFINVVTFTRSEIKVIHRLHGHISSVRTLAVSNCNIRQGSGAHVLFSGGGRAQMKAWKIHVTEKSIQSDETLSSSPAEYLESIWYEQVGSHMLGYKGRKHRKPWKKHLHDISPETRYMDLTAFPISQILPGVTGTHHLIAAACSDGYVRLFVYDEVKRYFNVIGQSDFHDHCVLSVKHVIIQPSKEQSKTHELHQRQCYILSAATDGKIAIWDATEVLANYFNQFLSCGQSSSNKNGCDSNCDIICGSELISDQTSATDASVHKTKDSVDEIGRPLLVISSHQSGVNAMDVFHRRGFEYLVASGGDDNCLCVHAVTFHGSTSQCNYTIQMPSAHSTQITGVKILGDDCVMSTSIDQRLSVWKVDHVLMKMHLFRSKFVNVADISCMDVWSESEDNFEVAVAGVGIQTLEVSVAS